jgi:hypothetical protein
MRRRRYDHHRDYYYGRRYTAPARYGYAPRRLSGLFSGRGAVLVLLALAVLVVLASLT